MNHFAENLRYKPLVRYIPLDKDICEIGVNRRVWVLENLTITGIYTAIDKDDYDSSFDNYDNAFFSRVDLDYDDIDSVYDGILYERYDFVLSVATIEHSLNIAQFLLNVQDIIKDNGTALITTPTPFGNFVHGILSKLGILNINAYRDHCIIFSGYRLRQTVKKCGFKVLKYKRYTFGLNQMIVIGKNVND